MGGSSFPRAPLVTVLCLWLLFLQPLYPYPVRKALADASSLPDNCQQVRVDVQHAPKPLMESLNTRTARLKPGPAFVVSASGASKDIFEDAEVAAEVEICPASATCQGDLQKAPSLMTPWAVSPLHAVLLRKPQNLQEHPLKHLFFIVSPSILELGVRCSNLSLSYACGSEKGNVAAGQCWSVNIKDLPSHKKSSHHLRPRSIDAIPNLSSSSQRSSHHSFTTILVASVLLLVGVVALIAVIALCGHGSQTYETQPSPSKLRSSHEVAQQLAESESVTLKQVESRSDLLTNGSLAAQESKQQDSETATRENGEPVSQQQGSGSSSPAKKTRSASYAGSGTGGEGSPRERSHSGWEQLPLPDVPKLEPAEDQPPETNGQPPKTKEGNEDEAGYAYATVAKDDKMEGSESEGEDQEEKAEGVSEVRRNIPPYGKVTRHPNSKTGSPEAEPEGDSYTEVRQFPPAILKGRLRSRTEPVEPADVVVNRDKRAFTHSAAHLPLPSIPGVEMDSQMYDIIPDDLKAADAARVDSIKPRPPPLKTPRERLYESVDDMENREPEDMYESVPDEIRHRESPASPKSPPLIVVPSPSVQRTSIPIIVPQPPPPPESPIPRKEGKKEENVKKKKLTKATSDTDQRKRSGSKSLFGRKKAKSVSVSKVKKEKDQHEPLPDIPIPLAATHTSPIHVSPPAHTSPPTHLSPPTIPPPFPPEDDDEEDTTYDRPQLDYPRPASESNGSPAKRMSVEESKMKSQSLPMVMRSAGHTIFHPRPNLPLPDLPEDSGSGAVATGVVLRMKKVEPQDPSYDTVVRDEDQELEVPYETVNRDEVFAAIERKEGAANEPPYDRVKKLLEAEEPPYDSVKKPSTEEEDEPPYDSVKKPSTEEEPPYDSVKGKEGPEGAAHHAGYGRVTTSATPDPHGENPEHDELGYAVIPANAIKKKQWGITPEDLDADDDDDDERGYNTDRRLETEPESTGDDDSTLQPKDPGYESVKKLEEAGRTEEAATVTAATVEDTYAVVDMVAKRLSQRRRKEHQSNKGQSLIAASIDDGVQSPPPVPSAQDLGVDLSEFEEPPVPAQSEGMHIMVEKGDPPYSRVLKVPKDGATNDPPYAKVIKEKPPSDNVVLPYASFNIIEGVDDSSTVVASKQATSHVEVQPRDSALGYDSVDVVSPKLNGVDPQDLKDAALGYDSIGEQLTTESATLSTSDMTIRVPTLEPAEPKQHMYDSLEGALGPEDELDPAAGTMYDCLLPQSVETESKSDEEDRYEEIDGNVRMNLIKMHLRQHTS